MSHQTTTITSCAKASSYVKDLIRFRELLFFLAWRDILVRYREAFFGIAWAIFRPLISMAVFAFLFGRLSHLPSDGVNYSLFVLAAIIPWQFFSNAIAELCPCLINNRDLVAKVYFPKVIIPVSGAVIYLVDLFVGIALLVCLSWFFGHLNAAAFLSLPFFICLLVALTLGVGFWVCSLTVYYRDFRILVPFFTQFAMFVSPVGYGTFVIPEDVRLFFCLNPMCGIIDGFRFAFFGTMHQDFAFSVLFSFAFSSILFISGFIFFRKMEQTFADVL